MAGVYLQTAKICFLALTGLGFLLAAVYWAFRVFVGRPIRQKNQFLNDVLESLTYPFYVINAHDFTIEMANRAACAQELVGKTTCHALSHRRDKPCDGADDPCPLREVKETRKPAVVEHIHFDSEGNPRDVEVHAYPILDKSGKVGRVIEYFLDITDRKRAEEELRDAYQRLVKASHRAGMAEVATDILHNVGNVLNSINVSARFIHDKLVNSKTTSLKKVADMVSDHTDDLGAFLIEDERGRHIPLYLTEVAKLIVDEHEAIADKIGSLTENVEHIKQIITAQQGYARAGGFEVLTSMNKVIEDAVAINHTGLRRHGVDIRLELADLPRIQVDRQHVLQILVNLISNGKYALSASRKEEKVLTIRCYRHGEDRLRVEVADNGVGIARENMAKIFQYGFTTKKEGHGFGLHSSALAAGEMGGSLTAHSDGPEQGATFILEIPLKEVAHTSQESESPQSH